MPGLNGDAGLGARRVAPEERERQELEARATEYRSESYPVSTPTYV